MPSKGQWKEMHEKLAETASFLQMQILLQPEKSQNITHTYEARHEHCSVTKCGRSGEPPTKYSWREKGNPETNKVIIKLEEQVEFFKEMIKDLQENISEVLDVDVWTKEEEQPDGEMLISCVFCVGGPKVPWERIYYYDHKADCAWKKLKEWME